MKDDRFEKIFILSNPFFWLFALLAFTIEGIKWIWKESGLDNTYYRLFKLHKQGRKQLEMIINVNARHQKDKSLNIFKLRGWQKASDKAQLTLKNRDD